MTEERLDIELYLVRHADAGDPAAWDGPDAARPLSGKGRKQTQRLARFLRDQGFAPSVLLTSPKVRAAETAAGLAEALGVEVRVDDRLSEGFGLDDLRAILRELEFPRRPVLVGHDPDFSGLVVELAGAPVRMRKGALARIDLSAELEPGTGTLCWLFPPDALAR